MKVTRKYSYKLTEKTLEEDIDKFILDARAGIYGWDRKCGGEGLRIIKQYFKLIFEKYKKEKFEECARCYKKLILFLFDSSTGRDEAGFGYEDLLSQVSKDFDAIIEKYFFSILKVYSSEDLANECYNYIINLKEYGFDSDKEVLIKNLEGEKMDNLINLLLLKTEGMTKNDEDKHGIIYFLMEIYESLGKKEKYLELCERFKGILSEKEIEYFRNNFGEDSLWEDKTKINGVWVDDKTGRILG